MAVIASKHIFGGGAYSVAGSKMARMVGSGPRWVSEISIDRKRHPGIRDKAGVYRAGWVKPYLPKHFTDPYHPTGNSLGYMIQTAHLMGADPIYLVGFTLAKAGTYFFGRANPCHKSSSRPDTDRTLDWLCWYAARYPGRAKLWPGWKGPVYDVLEVAADE